MIAGGVLLSGALLTCLLSMSLATAQINDGVFKMKRSTIAIISFVGTLAFALPVMAQDENSGAMQPAVGAESAQAVQQGNTTIVFKPAGTRNIDASRLRTWNEFAETHRGVAKELAYNSSLMNDRAYLTKHPQLDSFFQTHPDIRGAMAENPGNFNAIPPRPGE